MRLENFKKVQDLMQDLRSVNERLDITKTSDYSLDVYVKCKKNSELRVVFPPDFLDVAKRVIISSLEKQAKEIENKILEL